MILSEDIVRQVLSGKRTMVRLPIKTRPCQYKEGRAYAVKTATRAPISCHITIANVTEALIDDQNVWVIRFYKGDQTDKPRLLRSRAPRAPICKGEFRLEDGRKLVCNKAFADHQERCTRCGTKRPRESDEDRGYTSLAALSLRGELDAVSDQLLKRYGEEGRERHAATLAEQKQRLQAALTEIRRHAADPAINAKLRLAQQRVRQIRPSDVLYDHAARADHRAPERDSGC